MECVCACWRTRVPASPRRCVRSRGTRSRHSHAWCLAELAELVGVDRSTLSRQVAGVLKLGLVTPRPDENDKRASLLSLTDAGIAVKNAIAATWAELVSELVDGWSEKEKADLHRLLTKF